MFEWFSIQSGVVWKTTQVCLGGKKIFSSYKSFQLLMALKICRLPIFNMPFQLMLTNFFKSRLFFCYRKLITLLTIAKGPFFYFHIPNLKNVIINNTACQYSLLYLLLTTDNILWKRCLQWTTIWPNWWTAPGVGSVKVVIFNIF